MVTLEEFKKNAIEHGISKRMLAAWNNCKTKRQLADLAMNVSSIGFLCNSIRKGWGISPDELERKFSDYINGKYSSLQKGYSTKMYCNYKGDIIADSLIIVIINSEVDIEIQDGKSCSLYCVVECSVNLINSKSRATFVFRYGEPNDIKVMWDKEKPIIYTICNGD